VWVDETYLPYLDADATLAGEAARSRRLLVCMSMSKAYALSGARVAYLCGPPDTMRDLRRWSPPWAVSHAAQIGACAALRSLPYYRERWRETGALRAELAAGLAELGWETLPGVANFLLGRVPDDGPGAAGLTAACRARGLFLRDPAAMGRAGDGREVRVAVKDDATNRRMLGIIAEAMAAPDGA
jgi:histidinol-phosphate/aromatic aminotransferase/cobyric acid decarboxylase-like protein